MKCKCKLTRFPPFSRANEMRRMEKQLSVMLSQRAVHHELQENMEKKERMRLANLEKKTLKAAEERIESQVLDMTLNLDKRESSHGNE